MPIPLVLGAMALLGYGTKKSLDAYKYNRNAKKTNKDAKDMYNEAKKSLNKAKAKCDNMLQELGKKKLEIYSSTVVKSIFLIEKVKNISTKRDIPLDSLRNITFGKEQLIELKEGAIKAQHLVKGGIAAISGGALTAIGATNAVSALATASTGTAISTLSGAAATNATLAWLGGGSLASGGFGMAGGMVVLGGLVLGPALAIGGAILAAKAKENLSNAESNLQKVKIAVEEMKKAETALIAIQKRAEMFLNTLESLNQLLIYYNNELYLIFDKKRSLPNKIVRIFSKKLSDKLFSLNYKKMSKNERESLFKVYQTLAILKGILETPLIDKKGALTEKSQKVLEQSQLYLEN